MTYDDPNNPTEPTPWEPAPTPTPLKPGDPGYRPAPWAPSYDPGPNWNNGVAPGSSDPYANYNGGSPVDAPLTAGNAWQWSDAFGASGTGAPSWNMGTNNWDYGKWSQKPGTSTPPPPNPTNPTTPKPPGAVDPMPATGGGFNGGMVGGGGMTLPGSGLPQNILDLFAKKPDPTSVQSAYQDALLKYMNKSQQTPTLDDPMLAPQVEVFRAANQRNAERQRRVAVERASATGQNDSGYIDNQIKKGEADRGFNEAQFNSQLLGGEMSKRRQELQAALQIARTTGDAEAQRELQTRLAQVSAAMQQQGLNLQGQLGAGDLDLRWAGLGANTALAMENLNQRALQLFPWDT